MVTFSPSVAPALMSAPVPDFELHPASKEIMDITAIPNAAAFLIFITLSFLCGTVPYTGKKICPALDTFYFMCGTVSCH